MESRLFFTPNAIKICQFLPARKQGKILPTFRIAHSVVKQQPSLETLVHKIREQQEMMFAQTRPQSLKGISVFAPSFGDNINNSDQKENSSTKVLRSLQLFHGTSGKTRIQKSETDEREVYNPQLMSLLSIPSAFYNHHQKNKRAFLTSSMDLALDFASTSDDEMTVKKFADQFPHLKNIFGEEGEDVLKSIGRYHTEGREFTMQSEEHADALREAIMNIMFSSPSTTSSATTANTEKEVAKLIEEPLSVKTILALQVDFLEEDALPVESQSGPIRLFPDDNDATTKSNIDFIEDAHYKSSKCSSPVCCYSYLHQDSFQPCFGLLRNPKRESDGKELYRISTLAKIHFVTTN